MLVIKKLTAHNPRVKKKKKKKKNQALKTKVIKLELF